MPKFNDLASLYAYVNKSINKALETKVAPVVEQKIADKVQTEVYDSYSPVFYERRHELGNPSNIVSELISDGLLETKDVASPSESVLHTPYGPSNSTTFPGWVNNGNVPNIFNDRTDYPWMYPRDFIGAAVNELKSTGEVKSALAAGLSADGISVTTNVKRVG